MQAQARVTNTYILPYQCYIECVMYDTDDSIQVMLRTVLQ